MERALDRLPEEIKKRLLRLKDSGLLSPQIPDVVDSILRSKDSTTAREMAVCDLYRTFLEHTFNGAPVELARMDPKSEFPLSKEDGLSPNPLWRDPVYAFEVMLALEGKWETILKQDAANAFELEGDEQPNNLADTGVWCKACDGYCSSGLILIDGTQCHTECYDVTKALITILDGRPIGIRRSYDSRLSDAVVEAYVRIGALLSGYHSKLTNMAANIRNLATMASCDNDIEREYTVKQLKRVLSSIHDVWLTYPPDWSERRQMVLGKLPRCTKCGRDRLLHVHHRRPISQGGSHVEGNLTVLCDSCHRTRHGVIEFSESNSSELCNYSRTLLNLAIGMRQRTDVRFYYTSVLGEHSCRTITPHGFIKRRDNLCVTGYCHLRKATRTFSVRRIRKLVVVT